MPSEAIVVFFRNVGGFFPKDLGAVFRQVVATEGHQCVADFCRDVFGDRYEGYGLGLASREGASRCDFVSDGIQVFGEAGQGEI